MHQKLLDFVRAAAQTVDQVLHDPSATSFIFVLKMSVDKGFAVETLQIFGFFAQTGIRGSADPSSRWMAKAIPPRADESSLVRITPLTLTASLKARACWSAFWPVVASSTSQTACGAPGMALPTT